MTEAFAIYAVALCAVAALVFNFINLILLLVIRREVAQFRRSNGEAVASIRSRVRQIASFLASRREAQKLGAAELTAPSWNPGTNL